MQMGKLKKVFKAARWITAAVFLLSFLAAQTTEDWGGEKIMVSVQYNSCSFLGWKTYLDSIWFTRNSLHFCLLIYITVDKLMGKRKCRKNVSNVPDS